MFVNSAEGLVFILVTKNYEGQFRGSGHSAMKQQSQCNKVFQDTVITGCNFHFNQCL